MWSNYLSLFGILLCVGAGRANTRQKRYLLFTESTQWGVFATVSIPLHPETTTSVAWFYEANYYNVDNSTYLQPLLGDIPELRWLSQKPLHECFMCMNQYEINELRIGGVKKLLPMIVTWWGRNLERRGVSGNDDILTRRQLYNFIEAMLHRNGYPGRPCLLLSICEAATSGLTKNGVLGDLLHLALTPSASMEEVDLEDCFYEAEYRGLEHDCEKYHRHCPKGPLDFISVHVENM